jgi:hypothetical protein
VVAAEHGTVPSGGELLFCGHHARKHQERLKELEADLQQGQPQA